MDLLTPILTELDRMTWAEVKALADEAGVSYFTLAKVKRRLIANPGVRTVEPVASVLGFSINAPSVRRG